MMTWNSNANNGDPNNAQIVSPDLGNVVFVIGTNSASLTNDKASSSAYRSGNIAMSALAASVSCSGVKLASNLEMSWSVRGSLVSFSTKLTGSKAW